MTEVQTRSGFLSVRLVVAEVLSRTEVTFEELIERGPGRRDERVMIARRAVVLASNLLNYASDEEIGYEFRAPRRTVTQLRAAALELEEEGDTRAGDLARAIARDHGARLTRRIKPPRGPRGGLVR
jgi:hypothetical protein